MKEFLKESYIEPFAEKDWLGYVLGVFIWALSLAVVGLLLWLALWLIDSSFLPVKEKDGVVTKKYIVPAHTTTTFVMSGEVMVPIIHSHPTTHNLEIGIEGLSDNVSVFEDYYATVSLGQKVHCRYATGRLRNSLYIKSVE